MSCLLKFYIVNVNGAIGDIEQQEVKNIKAVVTYNYIRAMRFCVT